MKIEETLLCLCARQELGAVEMERVAALCRHAAVDWDLLFATSVEHLVAPLVYHSLQHCAEGAGLSVSAVTLQRFKAAAVENSIHDKLRRQKVLAALDYLHAQRIPVMLVKGIALSALVYQQPWYTSPEDVDLLLGIPRAKVTPAQRTMLASYEQYGIECDAFAHHDLTMNDVLPVDFQRIWCDAQPLGYMGRTVYVMAPEDLLITLCINSARKRFFRLKALCDIAETLRTYPNLDWACTLAKVLDYDVALIVYTALYVVQHCLGVDLPAQLWRELRVNPLHAAFLRLLCRRMSLTASSDLRSDGGGKFLGRRVTSSAILRYATLRPYQIGRQLRFMAQTRNGEYEFWDGV
ncbi:MAG: nucleotidyltransferase family protein [Caldilineaceae bacterium]